MSDLLALLLAAVLLAGTLAAAAVDSPRLPAAVVAVPGALLLTALGAVSWTDAGRTVREVAPTVGFLVLVLLLAELADREGLFTWAAAVTAERSGTSATALLTRVFVLAGIVTAVLSLDATVVLLTPVVVSTARRMRVPVTPHGYAVGHLANSASLLLPVSNLTNLLAVAATGLAFWHFAGLMLLPQVVTVLLEYLVLRRLFAEELRTPARTSTGGVREVPRFALATVVATVVAFGLASLAGIAPVWPAAAGAAVLAVRQLAARRTTAVELVRFANLPFGFFVLGLAVLVLVLQQHGLETLLGDLLPSGTGLPALLAVAGVSALLANLVNNLPATLALVPAAVAAGGTPTVLAVLLGVNLGPNLTYAGSLANLLWRRVLGEHAPGGVRFSLVGLATVPLTLAAATCALWVALRV